MIAILFGDGKLAVLVLGLAFVSVHLPKLFQGQADQVEKEYLECNEICLAKTQNILSCFLLVKGFGLRGIIQEKYTESTTSLKAREIQRSQKKFVVRSVSSGFTQLSCLLTIIFILPLVMKGRVSIGYVMSITQLMGGVMVPFETLPLYLMTYRTGKKECEDTFGEAVRNPASSASQVSKQMIPAADLNLPEMRQVSFGYPNAAPILRHINLTLDMKKKYAVVGGSGEGKSTLAKLLMGFLNPLDGAVQINGIDMRQIPEKELFRCTTISLYWIRA